MSLRKVDRLVEPGTLLVASPSIASDYFQKTVILISERTDRGIFGYVLNKKTIAEVRTAVGQHGLDWPWQDFMYEAGPVNRTSMLMIHTPEWYSSNTLRINDHVSISSDKFMFEKMTNMDIPINRKFVFGQSAWLEGQLEREISLQKSWLTTPATYDILWESDGETQWHRAIDHCAKLAVEQYF